MMVALTNLVMDNTCLHISPEIGYPVFGKSICKLSAVLQANI